jgi:hypothetical protein
MELEVKHLAPYLPYGLKLQYVVREKVEKIGTMESISHNEDETHPTRVSISAMYNEEHIWMFKPLLKSMRSLNNENVVKLKLFIEADKQYLIDSPLNCCYDDLQYLLSEHYDVFGLIDAGLATELS